MTKGKSGSNSYLIKRRTRDQVVVQIRGGTKRGGGTRRITRWGKWQTMHVVALAIHALEGFDRIKMSSPLSEVAVFHRGKRIEAEALRNRADDERRVRGILDDCNACTGRRRAGLEGQCPACANERTHNELERERAERAD